MSVNANVTAYCRTDTGQGRKTGLKRGNGFSAPIDRATVEECIASGFVANRHLRRAAKRLGLEVRS